MNITSLIIYILSFRAVSVPDDAVHQCQVCHKHFFSKAQLQQHLHICVNSGRTLKIQLQRPSEELVPPQEKPHSEDSKSCECQLCGLHLKSNVFLNAHVDLHLTSTPGQIKCVLDKCALIFSSYKKLKKHTKEHFQAPQFKCDVCDRLFHRKINLKVHMRRHTQLRRHANHAPVCSVKVPLDLPPKKRRDNGILYTCMLCGRNVKRHRDYTIHVEKHNTKTPGVFRCLYKCCNKLLFQNGDDLKRHTENSHEDVKLYPCTICSEVLTSHTLLVTHKMCHSDIKPFKCNHGECSFAAKTSQALLLHKEKRHTLHDFICSYCNVSLNISNICYKQHLFNHQTDTPGIVKCIQIGCLKTFSDTEDLKTHVQQQHKIECDVPDCLFTSKTINDLRVHRKSVHSIWPYNCRLCGKDFDFLPCFRKHMLSHKIRMLSELSGDAKCMKSGCQETFASITELVKHVKSHNPSSFPAGDFKPPKNSKCTGLECHLCGRILKEESELLVHISTHEIMTPDALVCNYKKCKQTFALASDLKEHAAKHWTFTRSGKRPFECNYPECNTAFQTNLTLISHRQKMHKLACYLCGKRFKKTLWVTRHIKRQHQNQHNKADSYAPFHKPRNSEGQFVML